MLYPNFSILDNQTLNPQSILNILPVNYFLHQFTVHLQLPRYIQFGKLCTDECIKIFISGNLSRYVFPYISMIPIRDGTKISFTGGPGRNQIPAGPGPLRPEFRSGPGLL